MPNKCTIRGCLTNYNGHEKGSVFLLPKDDDVQRKQWLKFLNFEYADSLKAIYICYKHFEPRFLLNAKMGLILNKKMRPVPTLIPKDQKSNSSPPKAILETISAPRKPPKMRVFQEDELSRFKKLDAISKFEDITEEKLKKVRKDLQVSMHDNHILCYILDCTADIPVVTFCIKIYKNLSVELHYKNALMHQPGWFRDGKQGNGRLTSFSMIENFLTYMKNKSEEQSDIQDEVFSLRYKSKPTYSRQLIRFALHLRHTSLQAYKLLLEEFKLPSISYLRSITSGKPSHSVKIADFFL